MTNAARPSLRTKKRPPVFFYFLSILLAGIFGSLITLTYLQSGDMNLSQTVNTPVFSPSNPPKNLPQLIKVVSPSVVSIVGNTNDSKTVGTGFVVDHKGTIVTAAHVVSDKSTPYTVVTQDKATYPAEVTQIDKSHDIAILKAPVNLTPLPLGNSDALNIGDSVVSIGNPYGILNGTVTTGVISGLHRNIVATDESNSDTQGLTNLIQIDAALNPGDSGGPLLDMSGHVIGITTASDVSAQNIGFAIPVNIIKQHLDNSPGIFSAYYETL